LYGKKNKLIISNISLLYVLFRDKVTKSKYFVGTSDSRKKVE